VAPPGFLYTDKVERCLMVLFFGLVFPLALYLPGNFPTDALSYAWYN